jgi:hypothetical protein
MPGQKTVGLFSWDELKMGRYGFANYKRIISFVKQPFRVALSKAKALRYM